MGMISSFEDGYFLDWSLILTEIFYHIFFGREPFEIILPHKKIELEALRLKAMAEAVKKEKIQKLNRHSKFGGTIAMGLAVNNFI